MVLRSSFFSRIRGTYARGVFARSERSRLAQVSLHVQPSTPNHFRALTLEGEHREFAQQLVPHGRRGDLTQLVRPPADDQRHRVRRGGPLQRAEGLAQHLTNITSGSTQDGSGRAFVSRCSGRATGRSITHGSSRSCMRVSAGSMASRTPFGHLRAGARSSGLQQAFCARRHGGDPVGIWALSAMACAANGASNWMALQHVSNMVSGARASAAV